MNTTIERFPSGSQSVPWESFMPRASSGPCPAVLVLHGSFGMLPAYRADIVSFAEAPAARGIGAGSAGRHSAEVHGRVPGRGVD